MTYKHLPNLVSNDFFGVISCTSLNHLELQPQWISFCSLNGCQLFIYLFTFIYLFAVCNPSPLSLQETPTYPLKAESKCHFLPETAGASAGPVTAPLHSIRCICCLHRYLIMNHCPLPLPPTIVLWSPLEEILNPLPELRSYMCLVSH